MVCHLSEGRFCSLDMSTASDSLQENMKAFSVPKYHHHNSRLLCIQNAHNSLLRKSNLDQERISDHASPTSTRIFRPVRSMIALLQAHTSIEREASIYDYINFHFWTRSLTMFNIDHFVTKSTLHCLLLPE